MSSRRTIIAEEHAPRLDLWLHRQFPDQSRTTLQRLIRSGQVLVAGSAVAQRHPIRRGNTVEIEFPDPKPDTLSSEDVPLKVLFEDQHLLVVNKPAGLAVHPGAGRASGTLANALLHHCRGQLSGIGGVERPGIVHRLDKDTSGCLVVAKTDLAHQKLAAAFQSRTVEKVYLALVWGTPRGLSGHIEQPIGRHPVHRKRMGVRPDGRAAVTDWKLRERLGPATLIECRIQTGRTHQIRVHLAHVDHPVVGDMMYGRTRAPELQQLAARQMLHAWRLAFDHPVDGKRVAFEAPIPEDMQQAIEACRELGKRSEK